MTLNDLFASELSQNGIEFEREFQAIPGRKFRFDFYITKGWGSKRLLVEIQGGIWMRKGAHNTGKAIKRDCEKLNLAVLEGYAVMHMTTDDVEDGSAIETIKKYLEVIGGN